LESSGGGDTFTDFNKMDGARNSLYFIQKRTYTVFNQERKQNRQSSKSLLDKAFPTVPYSELKHVKVKGNKSPYDGDMSYWSERKSKLYQGALAFARCLEEKPTGGNRLKIDTDSGNRD
jgi:RNA-directed DNA polymerase